MKLGRPNKGLDHVDTVDCDVQARERLRVVLATVAGEMSVAEACEALGISKSRFVQLRRAALQGAADALEPGRPGRPRTRDATTDAALAELKAELRATRRELDHERWQTDLALALPEIVERIEKGGAARKQRRLEGGKG